MRNAPENLRRKCRPKAQEGYRIDPGISSYRALVLAGMLGVLGSGCKELMLDPEADKAEQPANASNTSGSKMQVGGSRFVFSNSRFANGRQPSTQEPPVQPPAKAAIETAIANDHDRHHDPLPNNIFTFDTQGQTIKVPVDITDEDLLDETKLLGGNKEPKTFIRDEEHGKILTEHEAKAEFQRNAEKGYIDKNTVDHLIPNISYYVPLNDPLIQRLTDRVIAPFKTARERTQAIMDFTASYIPATTVGVDPFIPTPPRKTLHVRKADCKGLTVLTMAMTHAAGIDCLTVGFRKAEEHVSTVCSVGPNGSALTYDGKTYEWAESAGTITSTVEVFNEKTRTFQNVRRTSAFPVGRKLPQVTDITYAQRLGERPVVIPRPQHRP